MMMIQCVGTLAILLLTLAPAGAGSEPCEEDCFPLGSLSVGLSSIDPAEPIVGDTVTFTFDVYARLPGSVDRRFLGGEPVLAGDDPGTNESNGRTATSWAAAPHKLGSRR